MKEKWEKGCGTLHREKITTHASSLGAEKSMQHQALLCQVAPPQSPQIYLKVVCNGKMTSAQIAAWI